MANFLTKWWKGDEMTSLDLKRAGDMGPITNARLSLIRPDELDVSTQSLIQFSRKSELVYACIEKKAQAACDAELVVERKNADGEYEAIDGHPLVNLLDMPNPYDDGESFRRAWIASENVSDWFVCEKVYSNAGKLVELYPLHPGHITTQWMMAPDGNYIVWYIYSVNGRLIYYKPEELLIRRRHGMDSVYAGVSPIAAALGSIDADIAQTDYVRAFFRNSGIPSGLLKISGKNLSKEEAEHLGQHWDTKFGRFGMRQGGTAVLDQSAEYETIGSRLSELNSDVLTEIDETRICMAFGVPPIIIGAYVGLKHVNQKASMKGAMDEFWMSTMSPELKSMRKFLTYHVLPEFESMDAIRAGNIRVNWDMSHVAVLQEDLDAIFKRTNETYAAGIITLNEAREAIQMDPLPGPEGDAVYSAPPPVAPADNQPPPTPPKSDLYCPHMGKAFTIRGKCKVCAPALHEQHEGLSAHFANLEDQFFESTGKRALEDWYGYEKFVEGLGNGNGNGSKKNFELRREPTDVEKTVDIKTIFDSYETGKDALTKVVMDIRGDLITQAAKSVSDLTDKEVHELILTPPGGAYKNVQRVISKAVDEGRFQIAEDATKAANLSQVISFSRPTQAKGVIEDLIRRLVDLTVSRIINEVQSAAASIISALGVLGLDRSEIESRIQQELDERSDAPFEGIARQAVNSAVNAGRAEEMRAREDEIDHYYWSAILDKNVCGPCEELDGATANSLDQLPDAPYDQCEGGPNCRCFIIAVFEGEAQ